MADGYTETLDQAAFAARMDLEAARRSYSLDKLARELKLLVGSPEAAAAHRKEML